MRPRPAGCCPPALRDSFLLMLPLVLTTVRAVITPLGTPPSQVSSQVERCVFREEGVTGGAAGGGEKQCTKNKYFSIATCRTVPRVSLAGDGCNLLDLTDPGLYNRKRNIVFWGDSLTVQMYDALICLLRQSWQTSKQARTGTRTIGRRRHLMADHDGRGGSPLPAHHPRTYGQAVKTHATSRKQNHAPGCKAESQDECHRFGGLHVCYLRLIDHYEDMARGRIGCLRRKGSGPDSLHVFNFGLWYPSHRPPKNGKPPPTYPQALKLFRRFVTDALASLPPGPGPHLLWRETTPQFLDTPGGNYDRAVYSKESLSRCKTTVDAADMVSHEWRNAASSVALAGIPGLEVFHVWELLRPWGPRLTVRTPLVTEKGKKADCTHWCPGPLKAIGHLLLTDIFNRYWGNQTTL